MDTITHAISGAVVGAVTATTAAEKRELRRRMAWGAVFAAFPDIDFLMVFFVDTFTYLNEHRGLTHSLVLLPAWAALLGLLASRLGRSSWKDMSLLAGAALAAHILGDLITSYGTRFLMPVSDTPFAFPITFIIDPVFTAILLAGAVTALWRLQRWPAVTSGLLLFCYLGLQTWASEQAQDFGRQYAVQNGWSEATVIALPQPLSAMHWSVIVAHDGYYERSYIDLLEGEARERPGEDAGFIAKLQSAYRPRDDAFWYRYPRWPENFVIREKAETAWVQPEFKGFREFALLPYVSRIATVGNDLCVWTTDLRFNMPARSNPFRFAMCQTLEGQWYLPDTSLQSAAEQME